MDGGVGGLIMLAFGAYYLLKPVPRQKVVQLAAHQTKGIRQVLKGFC